MSKLFDFSGRESNERALQNTWAEFRQQLADGKFKYNEVEKAMHSTFLRVFDDLFQHGHRFLEKTVAETLSTDISIVRAARIKPGDPELNYDRFIPNAKFITSDNRFSPPGVEWLYLAFAKESSSPEYKIEEQCALKECRATTGDRFALCNFQVGAEHKDGILIDLTIAKESNYEDINALLEQCGKQIVDREITKGYVCGLTKGVIPKPRTEDIVPAIEKWAVFTYAKLLAEQIFVPITTEDKNLMYAPFQCIAQYFLSKGYGGIVYSSTVFPEGKNVVLFDKIAAHPYGAIRQIVIDF